MSNFIMLVGLPASGKSTYSNKLKEEGYIIHASDSLRVELFNDINNQVDNTKLFEVLHSRIKSDLQENKNVVYDATNIDYGRRKTFLEEIKKYNPHKKCILFATSYEDCLRNNESRGRNVPEEVIRRMYLNFDVPNYFEGWDDIEVVYGSEQKNPDELLSRLHEINQDNPNHTMSIGGHCSTTSIILYHMLKVKDIENEELLNASLFHDIGKEFTKEFKNGKGEPTEIAHYFNHHHVSAYDYMFYDHYGIEEYNVKSMLKTCSYIRWHMHPFFMNTNRSMKKFKKLMGEEFYNDIMLLNEADIQAK